MKRIVLAVLVLTAMVTTANAQMYGHGSYAGNEFKVHQAEFGNPSFEEIAERHNRWMRKQQEANYRFEQEQRMNQLEHDQRQMEQRMNSW